MKNILTLVISFLYSISLTVSAQSNDQYNILKTIGEIEIREYKSLIYASYKPLNLDDRSNSFRKVADFIFGSNNKNEEISMTSPVVIRPNNNYEMSFIMPAEYSMENLPQPTDKNIKIKFQKKDTKACIQYSGFSNATKEEKYISKLEQLLKENNIKHKGNFFLKIIPL